MSFKTVRLSLHEVSGIEARILTRELISAHYVDATSS